MKILFFIDRIGGGGRERRMAQLVCELDRRDGIEMMAVTTYPNVDYNELQRTSLKVLVVNNKSHIARLKAYEGIIKKFRPDVIHLWMETPLFCLMLPRIAHKYKSKFVAGFVADGNPLPKWSIRTIAIRYTFLCADSIVSNSFAGLYAKRAPMKKSIVINNGFDFDRLSVIIDKEAKRKEMGILPQYVVTMMARVNNAKDWQSFIRVAEIANANHLDAFFLAVGGGDLLDSYKGEVERLHLENIRFVGRRTDIEEILKITDVSMLFTSEEHHEGISNSIMESMAAGVPVIATEGGGTPEIITDGINSYIIPLHDVEKAYDLLMTLLSDSSYREFIGNMAKQHIREHFLLSKMGSEYLDLYNKLRKQ